MAMTSGNLFLLVNTHHLVFYKFWINQDEAKLDKHQSATLHGQGRADDIRKPA